MSTVDETTRNLAAGNACAARARQTEHTEAAIDLTNTTQLIAALSDVNPRVRRTAVDALADIGDPIAIEPLKALVKRETSELVPETAIQHALYLIAISEAKTRRRTAYERRQLEQEESALRRAVADLARRRGEVAAAAAQAAIAARELAAEQERVETQRTERALLETEVEQLANQEQSQREQTQQRTDALREEIAELGRQAAAEEGRRLAELELLRKKIEARTQQHEEKTRRLRAQLETRRPSSASSDPTESRATLDQASSLRAAAERKRSKAETHAEVASEGRQAVWEALRKKVGEDTQQSAGTETSHPAESMPLEDVRLSVPEQAKPWTQMSYTDEEVFEKDRSQIRTCRRCNSPTHSRQMMCRYCGHALPASHFAFIGIVLIIIALFVLVAKVGPMLFE